MDNGWYAFVPRRGVVAVGWSRRRAAHAGLVTHPVGLGSVQMCENGLMMAGSGRDYVLGASYLISRSNHVLWFVKEKGLTTPQESPGLGNMGCCRTSIGRAPL